MPRGPWKILTCERCGPVAPRDARTNGDGSMTHIGSPFNCGARVVEVTVDVVHPAPAPFSRKPEREPF